MARQTFVTVKLQDSRGKTISRRYEARDAAISDATVQNLASKLAAMTKLGVIDATVSRSVDISVQATTPVAGCSKNDTYSVRYQKSLLRNSHGGTGTFSLPELKDSIVNANGTIIGTSAEFDNFRELFDDGSGIAAIVGDFYVSDGEELIEDAEVLGGEINA